MCVCPEGDHKGLLVPHAFMTVTDDGCVFITLRNGLDVCVSLRKNVLIGIAIAGEVELSGKGADHSRSRYVGNHLDWMPVLVDENEDRSSEDEEDNLHRGKLCERDVSQILDLPDLHGEDYSDEEDDYGTATRVRGIGSTVETFDGLGNNKPLISELVASLESGISECCFI